jgi:hypothetical protein
LETSSKETIFKWAYNIVGLIFLIIYSKILFILAGLLILLSLIKIAAKWRKNISLFLVIAALVSSSYIFVMGILENPISLVFSLLFFCGIYLSVRE